MLRDRLAELLPQDGSVLDVGCGDGRLARAVLERRRALDVTGIDVSVRANAEIPVSSFDGVEIPFPAGSFDVIMLIDVLHHTTDPERLLLEAKRVAKRWVIVKDHLCESTFDASVLWLMDWIGNARHGVRLPHSYWPRRRWLETFSVLDMPIDSWETGLYPVTTLFGLHLHFIARLSLGRRNAP